MKKVLKADWDKLKAEDPKIRIREAARRLGTTEAQLLCFALGTKVTRLNDDFKGLLKAMDRAGTVMALTRNDFCVHERKGVYNKVSFNGEIGLAVNPDIDLRLFMGAWKFAFAVSEHDRLSFQFFDSAGEAVHKIYMTEKSDFGAYNELVDEFRHPDQYTVLFEEQAVKQEEVRSEVNIQKFQQAWRDLEDTHDFHGMLRKHGVGRRQSMDLAPEGCATRCHADFLKDCLQQVADSHLEIMVFTGNKGCIQIHTGLVQNLVQTGPWFNILDPLFNMHLREDGIESVWLVKKPTKDGTVTSIEVYDANGGIIVQFFGKRKPGIPENDQWREIVNAQLASV